MCTKEDKKIGDIQVVALACEEKTYLVPENNLVINSSKTTDCYLKISENLYLAIMQKQKPIGSDIDMCEIVKSLDYQEISITKN